MAQALLKDTLPRRCWDVFTLPGQSPRALEGLTDFLRTTGQHLWQGKEATARSVLEAGHNCSDFPKPLCPKPIRHLPSPGRAGHCTDIS